jgi:hypothetical protein
MKMGAEPIRLGSLWENQYAYMMKQLKARDIKAASEGNLRLVKNSLSNLSVNQAFRPEREPWHSRTDVLASSPSEEKFSRVPLMSLEAKL